MRGLKFRGRPPIRIAESVYGVVRFENPYAEGIVDRNFFLSEEFVDAVIAQSLFGWESRHPSPAIDEDGNFRGTDLDLLSFLVPLAERGAVIEIPHYRNRRPSVQRSNERRVGGGSRFGPITGLTSHQDVFSFSVRLWDGTVAVRDQETDRERLGAHRNFMLVDLTGKTYDGWDRIVWDPTAKENEFLDQNGLWTENTVYFKSAVHPNRWQSVFGAPYLLLKMLIERLREEGSFYRSEVKRLLDMGFALPKEERPEMTPAGYKPTKAETLEAVLDLPEFRGSYRAMPDSRNGLLFAHERQKFVTWTLKPKAQLVVRADELAYFLHGENRIASWMDGRNWKPFTPPGGRTVWNQMVLSSDVAYRFRKKIISQRVAV